MKWMFLFAVAALIPFGIRELPRQRIFSPEITLIPTLQLCYTLVLAGLLASFLMPVALKRIKATTVSMYINLQPIVAFGAAFIVGQDTFSIDKPLALILIIIGIYIVTQEKSKKETGVDQHE
jgi:drug/metabolite transporter (DMT)-like permease